MSLGYEVWFGLFERPFSLTPDARYHYRSRSHARALGGLSTALDRRVPLLLLTGELGTGKSTLCRTLANARRPTGAVVYFASALLTPDELHRRLVIDLEGGAAESAARGAAGHPPAELVRMAARALVDRAASPTLVLMDEAHLLPPSTADALLGLSGLERDGGSAVQIVLAAQPPSFGAPTLSRRIDEAMIHRTRLTPLDRDECEPYVAHRLQVAGGSPLPFSPSAVDVLYTLSGGVPRLVNLLCDRALHEAAVLGVRHLEPEVFEAAAATLDLRPLRERRVRRSGSPIRATASPDREASR